MPRPPRIEQDEFSYHITTRTNNRRLLFKKWTYKIIISVLSEATKKYSAQIEHFKMMDNHYHMKLFTPAANVSKIMWYINNQIAKRINKRMGSTGHLWGSRFHSPIVDNDEYAVRCVRYIYTNGVRAGLCDKASEDERFSTFEFYARGEKVGFVVTEDTVYLMLGRDRAECEKNFIMLVDEPLSESEMCDIRKGLGRIFYGSLEFIERMKTKYLN